MYIKQIIMEGFKSYGDRTVVGPFHPGLNVAVGRNGSGKSNFFSAIQFLISDEFSKIRNTERQFLIHESTNPLIASVEIIFDNEDKRLPIDKNEVFLKRMIGLKKDQYLLNKKIVTRTEVINLLEAAGFSRSNPYYIVKQGRVNQLAMTPESRMQLLREIARTYAYEEKRKESLIILNDTSLRMEKIKGLFETIDERLEILEIETKELKEYEIWEKQNCTLEYIIYDQTIAEYKEKINELKTEYDKLNETHKTLDRQYEELRRNIQEVERKLKKADKEVYIAKEERDILSAEQNELIKEEIQLKLLINNLEKEVEINQENKKKIKKKLEEFNDKINKQESILNQKLPEYDGIIRKEEDIDRNLQLQKQRLSELYSKQGRSTHFKTREERDSWIKNELIDLKRQMLNKNLYIENLKEDIQKDENKCTELNKNIEKYKVQIEHARMSIDNNHEKRNTLNIENDRNITKRKDILRKHKQLQDKLETLREEMVEVNQKLISMFGKTIFNGINSINKVIDTFRQQPEMAQKIYQYYGLVIENVDCKKSLFKPIEVIAGSRLFYHIIETNNFANEILTEMNRQKLPGEVTFMPIDRLYVSDVSYPPNPNAIPLILNLQYHPNFDKPLRSIFGRTLICRDLKTSVKLAKETKLDCVTLDGDQAASKGWMKGGYYNNQKSSMNLQKNKCDLRAQIDELEQSLYESNKCIYDIDKNINAQMNEIQRMDIKISKSKDTYEQIRKDINIMREELKILNKSKASKEKCLQDYKLNLETIETTKKSLENEINQELSNELMASEYQEIIMLNDSINSLIKELKEVYEQRAKLENEKNQLENLLSRNLIPIREKLQQDLEEILIDHKQQLLEECKSKLEEIRNRVSVVRICYETQNEKVKQFEDEEKQKRKNVDEFRGKEKNMQKIIEGNIKDLDRITNKKNILELNIVSTKQKIIELNIIPNSELYEKFKIMNTNELFDALEKVKQKLKKFDNMNKNAFDQYHIFSDQRIKLNERKVELDRANEKIKQLLDVLQTKKYEDIQFTFKQLSIYFSEIFQRLVPLGQAQLVMKTASVEESSLDTASSSSMDVVDHFIGIDVQVSFTGLENMTRDINQLSGGQKSLISLTLVFAIQRCDPAPFYLFDEIDQALDTEHRQAVALMINDLKKDAQFIITTFRPELLEYADQIYGVRIKGNKSSMGFVSQEEAVEFLEDDDIE